MTEPVAEIYREVSGYDGAYLVSNIGNIKSSDRKNNVGKHLSSVILKQSITRDGYLRVQLSKNGVRKSVRVHRLVAEAFIPNPDNLTQVNHIDEDKTNNRVDNLEWCTPKYNTNYGTRNKRASRNFDYSARNENKNFINGVENSARNRSKPIIAKLNSGEKIKFNSIREATEKLNISESSVIMVLKKRWKSCKGIVFEYYTPDTESVLLPVEDE